MQEKPNLIPVPNLATFRFGDLLPQATTDSPVKLAAIEMLRAYEEIWQIMPLEIRDFSLRGMKALGLPIEYPSFPFWVERAARQVVFLCFPTLKDFRFDRVDAEMSGRLVGHMLALATHAKNGTAIFAKPDLQNMPQVQRFYARIYDPLRTLLAQGVVPDVDETEKFLKGVNFAFSRTFDAMGWPKGWNSNSPVLIALCIGWRYIANKSPSLTDLHRQLADLLGKQEVGSEDRVKKICHRLGLRFSGNRTLDSQGTSADLAVPSLPETIPDK